MLLHTLVALLALLFLVYALWRAARRKLETRRNGRLMAHLDWTRSTRRSRAAPRKRGLLSSVLGQ